MENLTTGLKILFSFINSKRLWRPFFRNVLEKFHRVHIFAKSQKVQHTNQLIEFIQIVHFQQGSTAGRELLSISYSQNL